MKSQASFGVVGVLFFLLGVNPAMAQTSAWTGTGNWATPGNWSNGVPGSSTDAEVSSGSVTWSVGTLNGSGALTILSGATFNQTGGSLARDTAIGGAFSWTSGDWNSGGTTTVQGGGTLAMSVSGSNDFLFRALVNYGTVNWTTGSLQSGAGGSITNNGAFNDSASSSIFTSGYWGGPFNFINTGTYNKTAAGTTTISIPFANSGAVVLTAGTLSFDGGGSFDSTGTASAAAGTTLLFNSSYTIADASGLTGAGIFTFTNNLNISGNINASGFRVTAGSLAGTQTFNSTVTWNGGNLNSGGTTTIGSAGTLTMSGSGSHDFLFRALVNNGTVEWTGGALQSGAGGSITNNGTFNDSASSSIFTSGYWGGPFSFTNAGTYNKTAAGTTAIEVPFTNSGTLNLTAGNVELRAGGTLTAAGTFVAGAGTQLVFTNGYTIDDAARLSGPGLFSLSGGTLSLTGTLAAPHFQQTGGRLAGTYTLAGTFDMSGTDWNFGGTSTIAGSGVLNVAAGLDFLSRAIANSGTVNWNGGGLQSGLGGSITNDGTFNDAASNSIYASGYYGGAFNFTNTGTYNKTAAGTTTISIPFANTGTVNVQAGTLQLDGNVSGGTLSAGTWRVGDGARLNLAGDAAITHNSATVVLTGAGSVFNGINSLTLNDGTFSLQGGRAFSTGAAFTNAGTLIVSAGSSFATTSTFTNSGTLNVNGGFTAGGGLTNTGTLGGSGTFTSSLTNSGTLSPGNSPGLLTVTGNLTLQGSSVLVMELGGLVEGVSYDSIDVGGVLSLGGALNVTFVNGFSPMTGATFNLFDAASFNGTFNSMSMPTLANGLSWDTSALASSGLLGVTGTAIPEPSTYAAFVGLGALGLVIIRRRRATA